MTVLVIILAIFVLIIFSNFNSSKKAEEKSKIIDEKLIELKKSIKCVNGSIIPNKVIKDVLGVVKGISDQVSIKEEFELAEKEAMYRMLLEAEKLGANAVIEIKMNTGTYQQQGSKWQVTQIVYTATAVEIE